MLDSHFVPFETAAMLLKELSQVIVTPQSIWEWVQVTGEEMMNHLVAELAALKLGNEPEAEALSATLAAETLLMGADGVMVPFRPKPRQRRAKQYGAKSRSPSLPV
ncbi:MAG: hypothetical protein IPM39_14865 [Chloroflexi bacterium]|nr:hypothetical protein [Chloroflexota bacterium]